MSIIDLEPAARADWPGWSSTCPDDLLTARRRARLHAGRPDRTHRRFAMAFTAAAAKAGGAHDRQRPGGRCVPAAGGTGGPGSPRAAHAGRGLARPGRLDGHDPGRRRGSARSGCGTCSRSTSSSCTAGTSRVQRAVFSAATPPSLAACARLCRGIRCRPASRRCGIGIFGPVCRCRRGPAARPGHRPGRPRPGLVGPAVTVRSFAGWPARSAGRP